MHHRLRVNRALLGFCFACLPWVAGCDVGSGGDGGASTALCMKPSCSETAQQGYSCDSGASLQLGKYRVLNNLWGKNSAGVMGQQCLWSTCNTEASISWGTDYSWFGAGTGQVVSYTAAILGWHFSTIPADSGLPVQLSSATRVACDWTFRLKQTQPSTQDVAYDIWLSTDPNPTGSTRPTDEVMIWLQNSSGASPIGGGTVATAQIDGGNWALHEGRSNASDANAWVVHSFLATTSSASCTSLHISEFFDYLVQQRGLDSSKYLIGIEAGTEIFSGAGRLDTDSYSCTIE